MPLEPLRHLSDLSASQFPIEHQWGPGAAMAALGHETPAMLKNVGELSLRAVLGMQAALGEWIDVRFRHLEDDDELTLLNEAVWAGSVDYRYLQVDAMKFGMDDGPIDGPKRECKSIAADICRYYPVAEFGTVRYLVNMANLVKYVLPKSKPFESWFKAVVKRLPGLSAPSARTAGFLPIEQVKKPPRGIAAEIFGTPVPREAFDPTFDLESVDAASLIDAMLVRIAAAPNRFLQSVQDLEKAGFPGTPYRYLP